MKIYNNKKNDNKNKTQVKHRCCQHRVLGWTNEMALQPLSPEFAPPPPPFPVPSPRLLLFVSCVRVCVHPFPLSPAAVPWEPSMTSTRVMAGLWLLTSFVLGTVYRSNLKAMLIIPLVRLPFDTVKELADSSVPLYITHGSFLHQLIVVRLTLCPLLDSVSKCAFAGPKCHCKQFY